MTLEISCLTNWIEDGKITLKVVPNASKTLLKEENGLLKLCLSAVPEKGKANFAIVKHFKKEFGLKVVIVKGLQSKNKVLEVID